jgi:hypothetical protein
MPYQMMCIDGSIKKALYCSKEIHQIIQKVHAKATRKEASH